MYLYQNLQRSFTNRAYPHNTAQRFSLFLLIVYNLQPKSLQFFMSLLSQL